MIVAFVFKSLIPRFLEIAEFDEVSGCKEGGKELQPCGTSTYGV